MAFLLLFFIGFLIENLKSNTIRDSLNLSWKKSSKFPKYAFQYFKLDLSHFISLNNQKNDHRVLDLKIFMAPQHYQKLKNIRDHALSDGKILTRSDDDEVPAVILVDDQKMIDIKIRLKGDWADHFRHDNQWSFRVKIKGKNHIRGMKKFSIQKFESRGSPNEIIFLEMIKRRGILAPRTQAARIFINNSGLGLMMIEEHFTKELLEALGRKNAPILAFDDNNLWNQRKLYSRQKKEDESLDKQYSDGPFNHIRTFPLKVFNSKKWIKDKVMRKEWKRSIALMKGYLNGFIKVQQTFDVKKMAKYHFYSNLMVAYEHGYIHHNHRFYYNPITRLFEPFSYDNHTYMNDVVTKRFFFSHVVRPFGDPSFLGFLKKEQEMFKKEFESRKFWDEFKQTEKRYLSILDQYQYSYKKMTPEYFTRKYHELNQVIDKIKITKNHEYFFKNSRRGTYNNAKNLFNVANVFWISDANNHYLEIENLVTKDLYLDKLIYKKSKYRVEIDLSDKMRTFEPFPGNRRLKTINKTIKVDRRFFFTTKND